MWDVHVHLVPPDVADAAQKGQFGLQRDGDWIAVDGDRVLAGGRITDLQAVERYARQHGLSLVLSVPPALLRHGQDPLWASFANDALISVKRALTCDVEVLAILPFRDGDASVREWNRVRNTCVGVTVGGSMGEFRLSDPRYESLWATLAEGRALALVHGGVHSDPRLSAYYLGNLVGYPYEDTVGAADLVFSALPLKYPGLQWCISHGGGAAPFLIGRWQRGYETRRPGIDSTQPSPKEVYRALWFDSAVHDMRALEFLLEGARDHVVLGTDYPFPMGTVWHLEENALPQGVLNTLQANSDHLMERLRKG